MMTAGGAASFSIGQLAQLACVLEATAPKPGNVHRGAEFEDVTYLDFVIGASVVAGVLDHASDREARLGPMLLKAVRAIRASVGTNTNLGTLLLLVPLAMVPRATPLEDGVSEVLKALDTSDARLAYEAIRAARPGGMGTVGEADLDQEAPTDLVAAMRLATDRDLVAAQYANGFSEVFDLVLPSLRDGLDRDWPLADVIVHAYLRLMSERPDSLIARKCGRAMAQRSAAMASRVLMAGVPPEVEYRRAVADLDFWLRSDGHRRNPGTSADLVAAGLFAALRDGIITLPCRFYPEA